MKLVLISLNVGEKIGKETHHDNDKFFRFESGQGKCIIDGNEYDVKEGDASVITVCANHNILNTDTATALKM